MNGGIAPPAEGRIPAVRRLAGKALRHKLIRAVLPAVFACFAATACAEETDAPGLDVLIGQMLLVGFDGTAPGSADAERIARQIEQGRIGGVILMNRNIRSPSQVRKLTDKFLSANEELPPFVAVDQEGGIVQRLSRRKGFGRYPRARSVARRFDPGEARELYGRMARELKETGINLNLGPVVDLELERRNTVIARRGRSFGPDPARVTAYARAFIAAHRAAGVLTAAKHFPGHGSSRADSHKQFVDVTYSWRALELEPYRSLAASGNLDMVMVGHVYHPAFSGYGPARLPASLSPKAIGDWVRGDLDFQGVVVTDDLEMGAVSRHHDLRETLIRAVKGGNDILLFSGAGDPGANDPDFVDEAIGIIREAIENGEISFESVGRSYDRITALKQRLRIERPVRTGGLPLPVP